MEYVFLLGRVLFGGFFVMSGVGHFRSLSHMAGYAASKKVPMAKYSVAFTGLLLLLGGLGVLLGVYVQVALAFLVVFLIPAAFIFHAYWKDTDPGVRMGNRINFYKNIALLGAALMMYAVPTPWIFSLIK